MGVQTADIQGGPVSDIELGDLMQRAKAALNAMQNDGVELRFPLGFEFAGSPKAGKSTIIGLVGLFFRRAGYRVSTPPEGASIENPPDLKDDLLAFNTWCGCYAIQNILVRSHDGDPADILLLDRGLFDWTVWMEYLAVAERVIPEQVAQAASEFAMVRAWLEREQAIFLFTADATTALDRERRSQLTTKPGRAMNEVFLRKVRSCYDAVLAREHARLPAVFHFDTSKTPEGLPDFQRVAFEVAKIMLTAIEDRANQTLLVTEPIAQDGFLVDAEAVADICKTVTEHPRFMPRNEAERTTAVQQLVPYALIRGEQGQFLIARRRIEGEKPDLAGKWTMLFGGHAEKRDFDSGNSAGVFERCLERELSEELMGVSIQRMSRIGLINDVNSARSSRHLAVLHEVEVSARPAIRRQTADREFQRGSQDWWTAEAISREIEMFDPWSRIVASKLFGIAIQSRAGEPTLFTDRKP